MDKECFVQNEAGSTLFILDKAHEIQKAYCYDAFSGMAKQNPKDMYYDLKNIDIKN